MIQSTALDTNLLLLYVVGMQSRALIPRIKRLRAFTIGDFDLLVEQLRYSGGIVLTPNTVTETSNLLRSGPRIPESKGIVENLATLLRDFGEKYIPSARALDRTIWRELGVADAVLLLVAETGAVLLTTDLDLYLAAHRAGLVAVNFNYLRDF